MTSPSDLDLLLVGGKMRICPVCLEQSDPDPDGDDRHWHYGIGIEPVEVEARPFFDQLRSAVGLARFRLQEDAREHDFAEAERRWYDNLSVADQFWEDSRRKRVRREETEARQARPWGLSGLEAVLRDVWTEATVTAQFDLGRQVFGEWLAYPDAEALDAWLAEDYLPEVAEALGL